MTTTFSIGDRVRHKHTLEQGAIAAGPRFHTNRSRWWVVRWDATQKVERVWEVDLRTVPEGAA